jgi:hypothetical protein
MSEDTIRLNFEFPREDYPYLKKLCAQSGMTLKEFVTNLLLKATKEYEDRMLSKQAGKRLKELNKKDNISFDRACDEAGWEDEE